MIQMLFCTWIRGLIYSTLQFFQLSCSYGLPGIFACLKVCQSLSLSCCFQFHLLLLESIKFQIWNEKILLLLLLSLSLNFEVINFLAITESTFFRWCTFRVFLWVLFPGGSEGKVGCFLSKFYKKASNFFFPFFLISIRKRPTFSSLLCKIKLTNTPLFIVY